MHEKIKSQIDQAKNILLISHRNPDGDTLGSNCAFLNYFQQIKKSAQAFCVDSIPQDLKFLPLTEKFIGKENLDLNHYDLIIASDCGDIKQTGIAKILENKPDHCILINIDHHQTNNHYGEINLIKADASSTSEIIFEFFKKINFQIDKKITDSLLTGILTDTTYFSNAATTMQAVSTAADLLAQGASIKTITQNIWKNKSLQTLKLWGKIFNRLIYNENESIAIAIITQEDLQEFKLGGNALEGISNFLTKLQDTKIILVLWQKNEKFIKGSLRTTDDNIDVAQIAKSFGGGGHKKASGFTIEGKLKYENQNWWIE